MRLSCDAKSPLAIKEQFLALLDREAEMQTMNEKRAITKRDRAMYGHSVFVLRSLMAQVAEMQFHINGKPLSDPTDWRVCDANTAVAVDTGAVPVSGYLHDEMQRQRSK